MGMEDESPERSFIDVLCALTSTSVGGTDSSSVKDSSKLRLAAVAAAIVDVLTAADQGLSSAAVGSCSASQVYAKAVTALEGTLHEQVESSFSTQVALLELLDVTLPFVSPPTILSATFPLASRVLRATVTLALDTVISESIAKDSLVAGEGGPNAVLRWVGRVSGQLLKLLDQSAAIASLDVATVKQFLNGTLLTLLDDRRPKVRKSAHGALVDLLRHDVERKCHPHIRRTVNDYVAAKIDKARHQSDSTGECLHTLGFLEAAILSLDFSNLGSVLMQFMVGQIEAESREATSSLFVSLTKLKESTPRILTYCGILSTVLTMLRDSASTERKKDLDQFSMRVLASLLQINPSLVFRHGRADFDILQRGRTLYGQTLIAACDRAMESDQVTSCKLFPLTIQRLVLLSKPSDQQPEDTAVADVLMVESRQLFRSRLPLFIRSSDAIGVVQCLEDAIKAMNAVFEPLYRPTWSSSLKSFVVLIEHSYSKANVLKAVHAFLDLRNQVGAGSPSQQAVQEAFSSLVQGVGVEVCWDWIAWQPEPETGVASKSGVGMDSAWLLSALKTASTVIQPRPPRLAFFQDRVLPLARDCDKLAATSIKGRNFHRARVIDLWALFPTFCVGPCDLSSSLPSLTTTLSRAIVDKRYPEIVAIICSGIQTLADSLDSEKIADDGSYDANRAVMSQASQRLIPVLFKLVSESATASSGKEQPENMEVDTETEPDSLALAPDQIQHVADAVSSLAKFANKEFLQGIFNKLMHRLIDSMQAESGRSERVCCLLNLSQALASSAVLEEPEVALLYRTLKPLIRNDTHGARVQKRAYKVLAELCERYHAIIVEPERMKELTNLLTSSMVTSHVSARFLRLKCMNTIVEGFHDRHSEQLNEVLNVSAEILLCLKDSNAKTREAAYQLMISLSSRVGAVTYLKTVAAALAAETPHMRSAAVMACSRIVFERAWDDEELQDSLPSLFRTVLILIDEQSREVIKSVVGFIRICVAATPVEQLRPLVKEIVTCLLKYHKAKSRFRGKIKIIMKKLVKSFGYDFIEPLVPESEVKLMAHLKREDQRSRRKKERSKEERHGSADFDQMLESDEEASDGEDTYMTGPTAFSRLTSRSGASKNVNGSASRNRKTAATSVKSEKGANSKGAALLLPNENDGEIVDMLSSKISRRVKFAEDEISDDESDDGAMEFDGDGRLIVPEDSNEPKLEKTFEGDISGRLSKRRRMENSVGGSTRKSNQSKNGKPTKQQLGANYRSKKAGGDVKRKDQKLEPYAFVPLDGRSYSKKNRRAAVEQMSSVVGKGKRKR